MAATTGKPSASPKSKAPTSTAKTPVKPTAKKSTTNPAKKTPAKSATKSAPSTKKATITAKAPTTTAKKPAAKAKVPIKRRGSIAAAKTAKQATIPENATTPKPTCNHTQVTWLSPLDKFSLSSTAKVVKDASNVCEGISTSTCCSKEMITGIGTLWRKEVKSSSYFPKKFFSVIKNILSNYKDDMNRYASKQYPSVKKVYKTYHSIPRIQYFAFRSLSQRKFKFKSWSRKWKRHATKCSNHMQNIAKGSLCALCHTTEYQRFSNDDYTSAKTKKTKKIVYVPPIDIQDFALKCGKYIKYSEKMWRWMKYWSLVFLYKEDNQK